MSAPCAPKGRRFLPSQMRTQADDNRLETLKSLAESDCLPCTRRQWETFRSGVEAHRRTKRWLSWFGFVTILVFPIVLSVAAVIPLSVYLRGRDPTTTESISFVAVLTCASTFISACLGMMFTGTFPDVSSQAANAEQNVLTELKVRFDDLGHFLLKMSQDPELLQTAQGIAAHLDGQRLLQSLKSETTQAETRARVALHFLCNVADFLVTGNTCQDSYLESWAMLHQSVSPTLLENSTPSFHPSAPSASSSSFHINDLPPHVLASGLFSAVCPAPA
eukprot:GGOE01061561.1.p2 GENE.GGOE01061561.1~~GGOE01061561.1.p2  ORF type:complete len:277 (-),score=63.90 GGOE01061561.1:373-1203(-)